jgi:glutathione reductase (NADPH)
MTVMATTVDVIVLGTGSAAQSVAYPCREAGWSVAVVDDHPFGGTCPLRGCDPKRVLVAVSDLVDWSRRMQGKGVLAPGLSISWPDLIRFKRTFTDPVPEQDEQSFNQGSSRGVAVPTSWIGPASRWARTPWLVAMW